MKIAQLKNLVSAVRPALGKIKDKIVNFDIEPAKPMLDANILQAIQYFETKKYKQALNTLRQLLRRHPRNIQVLTAYIDVSFSLHHVKKARKLLEYGVKIDPNNFYFNHSLGSIYLATGELRAGKKCLTKAISIDPDSVCTQHLLAAVKGENIARPPDGYVKDLFDSYAESFEHDLINLLDYKSYIKLARALQEHITTPMQRVLDLGCGTGLLGKELKQRFAIANLTGVDIAAKMLEECKKKNLYDGLHADDLLTFLQQTEPGVDLITCSDVFVYMGDLEEVFAQSYRVLATNGFLAFTIEKGLFGTYKLMPSGRYQHSLSYIQSLSKRYLFSKMFSQTIDLRKEYGNMVTGYLVLLQK